MAFPWVSEANFEDGTSGHFDVESDTDTRLDFPHYSTLVALDTPLYPYRGAYCMRVALANDGSPADAYVQETGSWDMTAGTGELYGRFMLLISDDLVMANSDEFAILQFWSGTNTVECGIYINYTTANGLRLGTGQDTSAASQFATLTTGEWHSVEFFFDPAGATASTFDCWLDGTALTQQTGFTSADITSGVLGVLSQDATTTAGTVLFDQVITDDARVYPPVNRFPRNLLLTKTGHAFIGRGKIDQLSLVAGGSADNSCIIYDTDQAYTSDAGNIVSFVQSGVASETVFGLPTEVHKGAYAVLAGTNPRVLVAVAGNNLGYSELGYRKVLANRDSSSSA